MNGLDGVKVNDGAWQGAACIPSFNRFGSDELRRSASRRCTEENKYLVMIEAVATKPVPQECWQSWADFRLNERQVCRAVLDGIVKHYQRERPGLLKAFDPDDVDECVPPVAHVDDLESLIAFHTVHLHPAVPQGSDVGFEFECSWEAEHGLGVRVFGGKVVRVGHAEDAFAERRRELWSIRNMGDGMGDRA